MSDETNTQGEVPADTRRRLTPSNAVSLGAGIGAPLAAVIAGVLGAFGITLPVEAVGALGALLTAAIGYVVRGGRKGEPV
jgi:hypothetical protein